METGQYIAHDDPGGRTWVQRIRDCGHTANAFLGENIALNYYTAQTVLDAWKSSSGHNANMLNTNYRAIGIALDFHTWGYTWTTDFSSAIMQEVPTPTGTPTALAATFTSTNTITPTATPSSTSTPSTTATATSPSMGTYTADNLISDSLLTARHEGCLSLDPARGVLGYDWDETARPGGDPTGNKLTPWYQITIDHCPNGTYLSNPPIGSGRVQLKNFRSYALTSGAIPWRSMGAVLDPGQWGNYTIGFRGGCNSGWNVRTESEGLSFGSGSDPVCIAHGWVWPRVTRPEPTLCVMTLIDFRLLGSGSFLVNVGMDDYNNESIIKDVGIGVFRKATSAWRTVGMTSCTRNEIDTHPEF